MLVLGLCSKQAWACAACGFGIDDPARLAFLGTTGLLTFMPIILIGGVCFYLRRLYKNRQS